MSQNSRVALLAIIVEDYTSTQRLNQILHEYRQYIIGRMGIPYEKRGISIISIAVDAPADTINALTGQIGNLPGVSSKTLYSRIERDSSDSFSG